MAKPTSNVIWAVSDVNNVEPDSGHHTDGWATDEIPTSANVNWLLWAITQWIIWLASVTIRTQNRFPTPYLATNWAETGGPPVGDSPALQSSGSGSAFVDLGVDEGEQLDSMAIAIAGNTTVDGSIVVQKKFTDGTSPEVVGTRTLTNVPATIADVFMNFDAHESTGLTITVTPDSPMSGQSTHTRSAGSYAEDGYYEGQVVVWSGLTHSANNGSFTIISVSDAAMVFENTAVAETSTVGASVSAVATNPVVDDTFSLDIVLTANAANLQALALRIESSST